MEKKGDTFIYKKPMKRAKPNKLKKKVKKVDFSQRMMIKFKDQEGNETEQSYDLQADTTIEDLQNILKTAVENIDDDFEYLFYHGTNELRKNLSEILVENKGISTEQDIVITYQPQSLFKVRPVTRISSSLEGHKDSILDVAFSPNGKDLVSASGDHTLRFWDYRTETPISICKGHKTWVLIVAWSPDGLELASGDNAGVIKIWNPRKLKDEPRTLNGHKAFITGLSWQPLHLGKNCDMLASSSKDKTVKIWNVASGRCIYSLTYHTACVTKVLWGGEGFIYSSSEDRTCKVYSQKGEILKNLKTHAHWVNCLSLNTFHILRKGCYDEKCLEYSDRDEMKKVAFDKYMEAKQGKPEILVSGSDDCSLILWKPKVSSKPFKRLFGHQKPVNHVQFSPNGRMIVSASFDKSLRLWDLEGNKMAVFRGHIAPVYLVCWAADSRMFVSGSKDSTMKVWSTKYRKLMFDLPGHADEVYALDWSPDGAKVASGSKDRVLRIWQN